MKWYLNQRVKICYLGIGRVKEIRPDSLYVEFLAKNALERTGGYFTFDCVEQWELPNGEIGFLEDKNC